MDKFEKVRNGIDYTLKECPFCGNPAEIYDAKPYEWCPKTPIKGIRCNDYTCSAGHNINLTYMADNKYSEADARQQWNKRKRKNRFTWEKREETGGESE